MGSAANVIDKARKLLRLKERAGTRAEAEAAARALAKLLDKHRLSVAQLEVDGKAAPEAMCCDERPLFEARRIDYWRWNLILALARHFGVAVWGKRYGLRRPGRRPQSYRAIHLCGRGGDIEMLRHMFAWLESEALRLAADDCAGRGTVAHNSWRLGFVSGIDWQLERARAEAVAEAAVPVSTAMVLRNRGQQAADFLQQSLGDLRNVKTRSQSRIDAGAFVDGAYAGRKHHLGKALPAGRTEP